MIRQSIKKELILVFSDLHSLAVLLLMPVVFMLIMTLAMSERQTDVIQKVGLNIDNTTPTTHQHLYLKYLGHFGYQIDADKSSASAHLSFSDNFATKLFSDGAKGLLMVDYTSQTSPAMKAIINQHLQIAFARLKLHLYMLDTGELDATLPIEQQMDVITQQSDTADLISTAEQHVQPVIAYSVPSWLIFGVYFIVLPISLTLLNEKQNGTLIRLKTFPINMHLYFAIKLLAFYCISLGQFLILSLIGLRIIPKLVNLPLIPYQQLLELLPVGCIVCLAAVCFAAIIAASVHSFEQAIVLGGGINIIMAALSGFMVPLDVMPQSLQNIAHFSPMFWSAELVKEGMFATGSGLDLSIVASLCLFAAISLLTSALLFSRKIRKVLWN